MSTADAEGAAPYLIPLSYLWDGTTVLPATPGASPTGRNLRATGAVRPAFGPTRDVVVVDGSAETLEPAGLPAGVGDAFTERTGFDPRGLTTAYLCFRVTPRRVRAWREADEIAGRDLMRDGAWLVDD